MPPKKSNTKSRVSSTSENKIRDKFWPKAQSAKAATSSKKPVSDISKILVTSSVSKNVIKGASTTSAAFSSKKRKPSSDNTEGSEGLEGFTTNSVPERYPSKRLKANQTHTTIYTSNAAQKEAASSKKGKTARPKASQSPSSTIVLPIINKVPTQPLIVMVFGNGECGELGLGRKRTEVTRPFANPFLNPSDTSKFHVVQLDCGGMHTIALTENNKIVTWGVNDNGALGRDTNWDGGLCDIDAGSDDESVGELNPFECTPTEIPVHCFPPSTEFVQVTAGDSCSFALTNTGLVYGWGTFVDNEGKKRFGYDANEKLIEVQPTPIIIQGLKNITQIACGANHAIALEKSGNVWAWGAGEQNQLGRRLFGRRYMECIKPHRVEVCRNNAKYIASGLYHSFVVDRKDNVWAWGLNSYGEAGYAKSADSDSVLLPYPMKIPGLCNKGIVVLDGGAHHSAAVTADGQFLVWGRVDGGQLGIKFSSDQLEDNTLIRRDERNLPRICLYPTAVPNIGDAAYVGCGTDHTIFINKEGKAYSAGFGTMGQLGLGSSDDADVAEQITGKQVTGRMLTWTDAGGQFSVIAAPANISNGLTTAV